MGSPFFTWMPFVQFPTRIFLPLGEDLSDLQVTPTRQSSDAVTIAGLHRRTNFAPGQSVRVVLERFTDRGMFRQFQNMINHLERGGYVSFGLDDTKAYGAAMNHVGPRYQGSARVEVGENLYVDYSPNTQSTYAPSGSTSAPFGEELIIETPAPYGKREYHAAYAVTGDGTATGATIDLDASSGSAVTNQQLQNDYYAGALVRVSDFWPKLYLPSGSIGSPLLTHDHRISYTLDIGLQYCIPDLVAVDVYVPPAEKEVGTYDPQGSGMVKVPQGNLDPNDKETPFIDIYDPPPMFLDKGNSLRDLADIPMLRDYKLLRK